MRTTLSMVATAAGCCALLNTLLLRLVPLAHNKKFKTMLTNIFIGLCVLNVIGLILAAIDMHNAPVMDDYDEEDEL